MGNKPEKQVEDNNMESRVDTVVNHAVDVQRKRIGFLQETWEQAQLVWRLFKDREVPIYLKALPIGALVYLISPLDLLPDFIFPPIVGQLDDFTALLAAGKLFIELSPKHVVEKHLAAIRGTEYIVTSEAEAKVIEGELGEQIVIRPHEKEAREQE
ncbi:MAG: DUF1232 domain-containing protein [Anaerolineales bacterium]|nr:DUF1232 domain-containing protein [Anaerolineales bacterium]MCB8960367.1 DUF1232 domain-containing protein [Ardenticatenales bacterium]